MNQKIEQSNGWRRFACLVRFLFVLMIWSAMPTTKSAQLLSQEIDIPYRRLYVPKEELRSIDLEEFTEMEIRDLTSRLERWSQTRSATSRNGLEAEPDCRLVASHYFASLSGADLVSEASRLKVATSAGSRDRLALQPWSLALGTKLSIEAFPVAREPSDSRLNTGASSWTFDARGTPKLPIPPKQIDNSVVSYWLNWSARSLPSSQPNRLRFALDIPKCEDSCLLLALPLGAAIQDANRVAVSLKAWSEVEARIGPWPLSNSSGPIWLIELGGSTRVEFTVALGIGGRETTSPAQELNSLLQKVVRTQTLEHTILPQGIVTRMDAEVLQREMVSQYRLPIPTGSRLLKLEANGLPVDWQEVSGCVQWNAELESEAALTSMVEACRIEAEFITSRAKVETAFELPRFGLEKSYVVQGATSVKSQVDQVISASVCEGCRPADSSSMQREGNSLGLDFVWHVAPPSVRVELQAVTSERKTECIVSLTPNEDGVVEANLRGRFLFLDQDSNEVEIRVPNGWSLLSIVPVEDNDPFQHDWGADEKGGTLHKLTWPRIQKNRVTDLEMKFVQDRFADPASTIKLDGETLISIPDWHVSTVFVVNGNARYEPQLDELNIGKMIPIDAIPEWQRSVVSKRVPSILVEANPFRPDSNLLSSLVLPALSWRQIESVSTVGIESRVASRVREVAIEHILSIASRKIATDDIEVAWDKSCQSSKWWKQEGQDWIALKPIWTQVDNQAFRCKLSSISAEDPIRLRVLVEQAWQEPESTEKRQLSLRASAPRVLNSTIVSQLVRSESDDIVLCSDQPDAKWAYDVHGKRSLHFSNHEKPATLLLSKPATWKAPSYHHVEVDLLVDSFSNQSALVQINTGSTSTEAVCELPSGWSLRDVRFNNGFGDEAPAYYLDGQRLILGRNKKNSALILSPTPQTEVGPMRGEFQLILVGPKLSASKHPWWNWNGGLVFSWPNFLPPDSIADGKQRLWLPNGLQIRENSRPQMGKAPYASIQALSKEIGNQFLGRSEESLKGLLPPARLKDALPKGMHANWSIARILDGVHEQSSLSIESSVRKLSAFLLLFTFALLVAPWILQRFVGYLAVSCGILLVESYLDLFGYSLHCSALVLGLCAGYCVWVIHRCIFYAKSSNARSAGASPSRTWVPWNEREEASDSNHHSQPEGVLPLGRAIASNAVMILFCLSTLVGLLMDPIAIRSVAQDRNSIAELRSFDVIIPVAEDGTLVGDKVLVPNEMRNLLLAESKERNNDKPTQLLSARYFLRGSTRSRTDQLVMTHDFWVGEDLQSIRFPFNLDQLESVRMAVDGVEASFGTRLRRNGNQLEWSPDRPGKRTVQIFGQPILQSSPSEPIKNDSNRTSAPVEASQQILEMDILPAANATFELEMDSPIKAEINAQGSIVNPANGRYIAQLGLVNRLQCRIVTTSNLPINSGNLDAGEPPIMNTELHVQLDSVQAKTIMDFPATAIQSRTIEMEADQDWTPIGTDWGDARCVEVLAGSSLSRKKYVLEWMHQESGARQVSIMWVPAAKVQSLNILFAECKDRRTRLGTLRYSIAPGSQWSLEGINDWIPSINSRERLEWPELKNQPIATTLRIPSSGGFGILKMRTTLERQQARVTSKWTLDATSQTLVARLELSGVVSRAELLRLEIPEQFKVTDVSNRSGPIRYLQSLETVDGKKRRVLQIFANRRTLDVSDFLVQAQRVDLLTGSMNPSLKWDEVPWLRLPSGYTVDHRMEVYATDAVCLQLEKEASPILAGKGAGQSLIGLSKTFSPDVSTPDSNSQYRAFIRDQAVTGQMALISPVLEQTGQQAVDLLGSVSLSARTRSWFVLDIPAKLRDRWYTELKVNVLPFAPMDRVWLQVHLPDVLPKESGLTRFSVRFESNPDETDANGLPAWASICALNKASLPTFIAIDRDTVAASARWKSVPEEIATTLQRDFPAVLDMSWVAMGNPQNGDPPIGKQQVHIANRETSEKINEPNTDSSIPLATERITARTGSPSRIVSLIRTTMWIDPSKSKTAESASSRWQLPESSAPIFVHLDGKAVPYIFHRGILEISIQNDLLPHHIAVVQEQNESTIVSTAPSQEQLMDQVSASLSLAKSAVENMANKTGRTIEGIANSDWERWVLHWGCLCLDGLQKLAPLCTDAESARRFGDLANQWGRLRKSLASTLDQDSVVRFAKSQQHAWSQIETGQVGFVPVQKLPETNIAAQTIPSFLVGTTQLWLHLVLALAILFTSWLAAARYQEWFVRRPWWSALGVGILLSLATGTLWPALAFGFVALLLVVDSYWFIIERLRRTETRVPR